MLRPRPLAKLWVLAGLAIVAAGPASAAPEPLPSSDIILRYGIAGFIQPIGLHHGFHIEQVEPTSPAAQDHLMPHDIIVKVDGEAVRSLEHLRTLLTDAYDDDGMVLLTILKDRSLEHHVVKGFLKGRDGGSPPRKAKAAEPEGDEGR